MIFLLSVAVSACAGGGGSGAPADTPRGDDESAAILEADGPLGGVLLTAAPAGNRRSGPAPRLTFTTADTELYAVTALGNEVDEGSTLSVAWYRLEGDGTRALLFRHELPVDAAGGRAVSQGVAKGGLAPGMYETVATLGEHEVRTPWFVRIAAPAGGSGSTGTEAQASASSSPSEDVDWGAETYDDDWSTPEGGYADWGVDDGLLDVPSEPPGPCTIVELRPFAFLVTLTAELEWEGTCSEVSLAAAVTGSPRVFASISDPPNPGGTLEMDEWYCDIPGGSDFPGTVVRVAGTAIDGAPVTVPFTLPDRSEEFGVEYESVPAVGARVEPGDTIRIRAFAVMLPPSLGVRVLYLDDGNELIDTTPNRSGATEPVSCDKNRLWALLEDSRYRVPDDPPPIIEICAYAEGFNDARVSYCGNFYTGEVWKGTMDGTITIVPPGQPGPVCPNPIRFHGDVRFVVAANGSATGFVAMSGPCVESFDLTGKMTASGITFSHLEPIFADGPIPIVRPGRASDRVTHTVGGATIYVTQWDLACANCEEETS